ncbi:MAG: MFS transporter [Pseudomonadota bacterium]
MPNTAHFRFDQRYLIVFGACLTQFTVIGLMFSYALFFKYFETEFGWSRTLLSACLSFAFFTMGVLAFFGGQLSDRFGPRIVLAIAGTLLGIGWMLLSRVTEPWQLFVFFGLLLGAGMGTHDVVTLPTIAKWFEKRRGIMTGVVKVGTAVGQVTVPPLVALLLTLTDWRLVLVIVGAAAIALLLLAAFLLRAPPKATLQSQNDAAGGLTFAEARRTPRLWMLCFIQFSFFPALMTIPLHLPVHGMDLGMSQGMAATLLSVIGATSVAGRLLVGACADRLGGKRAFVLCFVPLIISLSLFPLITAPWLLFPAVIIYGFGHGGFFTVVAPTIAEYFGLKAHGTIFGLVLFFGTIGGATGPIVAGRFFDTTQSYTPAFVSLAALAAIGLLVVLRLPRAGTGRQ